MRKNKEFEIIRTNEEPIASDGMNYFIVAHAKAEDETGVVAFERALREDLLAVSSKIPSCVDPRVLLVMTSEGDAIRLTAKAPCSGQKDLRFWVGVRPEKCNALSARWFAQHIQSKRGVE